MISTYLFVAYCAGRSFLDGVCGCFFLMVCGISYDFSILIGPMSLGTSVGYALAGLLPRHLWDHWILWSVFVYSL